MILTIIIIPIALINIGCGDNQSKREFEYRINVFMEKKDMNKVNPVSWDNQVYFPGSNHRYNYTYKINEESFKVSLEFDTLRKYEEMWDEAITYFDIEVIEDYDSRFFTEVNSDYLQTSFNYRYYNKKGKLLGLELTGLVENEKNIFIHPPRVNRFRILRIAPNPILLLEHDDSQEKELKELYNYQSQNIGSEKYLINTSYKTDSSFATLDAIYSKKLGWEELKYVINDTIKISFFLDKEFR